jgi:hypothetical protein
MEELLLKSPSLLLPSLKEGRTYFALFLEEGVRGR